MQKKTFFAYAIAIAGIVILSGAAVTPALSREAQKAMNATTYQLQSAELELCLCAAADLRRPALWAVLDRNRLQPPLRLQGLLRQSRLERSIARSDVQSGMVGSP